MMLRRPTAMNVGHGKGSPTNFLESGRTAKAQAFPVVRDDVTHETDVSLSLRRVTRVRAGEAAGKGLTARCRRFSMTRSSCRRLAIFAAAIILNSMLAGAAAFAAVDVSIGTRSVVDNAPVSQCSAKAKDALNSVLQGAVEAGAGTGQWLAYGPPDSDGRSSTGAAIHCYPVDKGYVATFTCTVEVLPNADTAAALCTKLTTAFGTSK